jgi:sugar lactone lactonase YvrE
MLRFRVLAVLLAVTAARPALLAQPYTFTTLAGPTEPRAAIDGTGEAARFNEPTGIAVDGSGNVYVADRFNNLIRKISPSGAVTTLAGGVGLFYQDGVGSTAGFYWPRGVAVDRAGNVFVADSQNHTIRKITPAGLVTTVAGKAGTPGSADGTTSAARFNYPVAVAVDAGGNLYIADQGNRAVRKISAMGVVTTLPGHYVGNTDNPQTSNAPAGVAVDSAGNVYVAGGGDCVIQKITPEGLNTRFAGALGQCRADDGGRFNTARFLYPTGIAVDESGVVWVADRAGVRKIDPRSETGSVVTVAEGEALLQPSRDSGIWNYWYTCPYSVAVDNRGKVFVTDVCNNRILTTDTSGMVSSTLAGKASRGVHDGPGREALFDELAGVVVGRSGNVYVADHGAGTIRKITPSGEVTTLNRDFLVPMGLAIDSNENLYVTYSFYKAVSKITPEGVISTFAGPAGIYATEHTESSVFDVARNIACDNAGNLYVTDSDSHVIRKITSAGVVSTLAGLDGNQGSADGAGSDARFNYPTGIAADDFGNVYVADTNNRTIRRIRPDGTVSTLAGLAGVRGTADGFASQARFDYPVGVAVDGNGDVYVTENDAQTIRKISPGGDVTTVAGDPHGGQSDVDGTGNRARFFWPKGIATDHNGTLYVTDNDGAVRIGKPAFGDVGDMAIIDTPRAAVATTCQLDASPKTASGYQWSVIRRPADSVAELSSSTIRNPTFTPDMPGLFVFRLVATGNGAMRVSTIDLTSLIPPRRHASH